jgi:ribosome-associated translation inhibitor RaiA
MTINLGGNINLVGFKELDRPTLFIVRKMVGNYVRKLTDRGANLTEVSVSLKSVHATENSQLFELKAKAIDNGAIHVAEHTDRNLFVALDKVMEKIEKNI